MHMHDLLFHVIFGSDYDSILEMVHASVVRLYSITGCKHLKGMMECIVQNCELGQCPRQQQQDGQCSNARVNLSADVLKASFFLLLNVDMVLKEFVCNPCSRQMLAAAMNIQDHARSREDAKVHNQDSLRQQMGWGQANANEAMFSSKGKMERIEQVCVIWDMAQSDTRIHTISAPFLVGVACGKTKCACGRTSRSCMHGRPWGCAEWIQQRPGVSSQCCTTISYTHGCRTRGCMQVFCAICTPASCGALM